MFDDVVIRLREMEGDMIGPYRGLTLEAVGEIEFLRAKLATQLSTPPLAYPPAQAAKVIGRSYSRIKKAVRERELTARKDGRATLIEHAELVRWIAGLPTIGRKNI